MVNHIIFDDEITLYWEKECQVETTEYKVFLNGEEIVSTKKSHCIINRLSENTKYSIEVKVLSEKGEETIFNSQLFTSHKKKRIDVTKDPYNAIGDSAKLNTVALQKAIDDCGEDECVYIPKGVFLTGALNLHSNMEVYVEEGAVLQGTSNLNDYTPKIKSRFEGIEMMCYRSLINIGELDRNGGYSCENIVIRGGGTIYGGGRELAENTIEFEKEKLKEFIEQNPDYIATCENQKTVPARSRGRLINISNGKNVVIGNLMLGFGPAWNLHMIYSSDVVTYGCVIHSENVWNGDGWDPDSSENCTIFNCEFFTGDDAIAIKSGKNPEGNIINKPCKNIKVFDCISHFGHGITIGSEMSGGVSDVHIWNCDLVNSQYGVQIKGTKKRGGFVRRIHVNDCDVSRILMQSVPYNDDGIPAPTSPIFEDCSFENLNISGIALYKNGVLEGCNPIEVTGFDTPEYFIKNIKFKNINIGAGDGLPTGIVLKRCNGIVLENICCK